MLGWLIRVLFIAFLVRALWRVALGVLQGLGAAPASGRVPRTAPTGSTALVKDPVCGTYVAKAQALSFASQGTTHYFCSEDCRQSFQRDGRARALQASRP